MAFEMKDGKVIISPDGKVNFKREKEKVCIIGFAPTWKDAPLNDDSFEFWGCNEIYMIIPKIELLFELHGRKEIADKERDKVKQEHLNWLKNARIPIMMQKHYDDIPNSLPFPKDQIVEKYGTYFTNTISWQIALAIDMGFKEIHLYGVNMANEEEYMSQRPSVEYFVGLAEGKGIKVYIPEQSDLCKSWTLYGFEDEMSTTMSKRIKHLHDEHLERKNQCEAIAQNNIAMMHQSIGFMQATDYMQKAFIYPNANFNEIQRKET